MGRECTGPAVDKVGEPESGELPTRISQRADERVVRQLEAAISTRDQDQIPRLLGGGSQQPHAGIRPLQLASLGGETKRQHAKARNRHQSGEQGAERIACAAERLDEECTVTDEWNEEDRQRGERGVAGCRVGLNGFGPLRGIGRGESRCRV